MMQDRHPLEQEVLNDYKNKFDAYMDMCYKLYLLGTSEKDDKDLHDLLLKKAAGCKMMIDYMEKNKVMGTN